MECIVPHTSDGPSVQECCPSHKCFGSATPIAARATTTSTATATTATIPQTPKMHGGVLRVQPVQRRVPLAHVHTRSGA